MYQVSNTIIETPFNGLKVSKLKEFIAEEVLHISLEKGELFPKHSSPRDAYLIVLDGEIIFYINSKSYQLKKHQTFSFPKKEEHWVEAIKNSNFLIIR